MTAPLELHVLRVFVAPDGRAGNQLGVFLDGATVPADARQRVAAELGFSETVYVDDRATCALRIFTPATELGFAGHPLVGTAWLLADTAPGPTPTRDDPLTLRPPVGETAAWLDGPRAWVRARPEWSPAWELVEFASPRAVADLTEPPGGHVQAWAWQDEPAGHVFARVFAADYGVPEDPATGSAAIVLAATLQRELLIRQGAGSDILARPAPAGYVELGGRVALEQRRHVERREPR